MSVPNQTTGNEYLLGEIAGIPIRFSPWYLLLVLIVFWRTQDVQVGLIILVCLTWSVVLHELGHGVVAKAYGARPSIVIHAFGGYCERAAIHDRRKNLWVSAAGPLVSLSLAGSFWVFEALLPTATPGLVRLAVSYMATTNMFWAAFNLLPVLPMDGGRMLQLQLGYHVSSDRADGIAAWVGALFGVVGAVAGWVYFNSLLIAVFLGMMAWQNMQQTAFYPFQRTFQSRPNEFPATRGTSGFELPPIVAVFVGALVGAFIASTANLTAENALRVLMIPQTILEGGAPWTMLTSPYVHGPWAWGPMLFALTALWWFGPPVRRVLGSDAKFVTLYAGSLLLGSLSASFLAGPLGIASVPVYGAGAGSLALLVAWARFAVPGPLFYGYIPLQPRHLAALVVIGEPLVVFAGLADFNWHAHVAGLLFGLVMPAEVRAENVVDLFPQGGQDKDVWH